MSNRLTRILTAIAVMPPVIAGIIWLNDIMFFIVLLILILGGTWEFYRFVSADGKPLLAFPVMAGAVLIPTGFFLGGTSGALFGLYVSAAMVFVIKLFGKAPLDDTYEHLSVSMISIMYYPFFMSFFIPLREIDFHWLFYLCAIIWFSDSFAYFIGVMFGKRKMYELISPKKSMEGLAGGFLGGIAGAFLYTYFFMEIPFHHVLISSILLTGAGVVGDLVESMFKRKSGIKDSGTVFPGHGGVLDRTDSIAFAAPILYFYVTMAV
ncbi:MAG TPA: phosphatidate cytidylyltransferase [Deferribacteraceae bacterium]|nr:phosphatidate cytidylyltransferase [Deferribacteraceae bacterium]